MPPFCFFTIDRGETICYNNIVMRKIRFLKIFHSRNEEF